MTKSQKTTLFISDVHLSPDRPEATQRFCDLLSRQADKIEALYLLGDVFDVWLGDDLSVPMHREAIAAIKTLADSGVAVYCIYGNHDFTMGSTFTAESGCRLLREPVVTSLYGETAVLLHGDSLCTSDVSYQRYRAIMRSTLFRKWAVRLPKSWRRKIAEQLKSTAGEMSSNKPLNITDVQEEAVIECLLEHECHLMIHGHTHRANRHTHSLPDGSSATRIVLGDWYGNGDYALASTKGIELRNDQNSSDSKPAKN